MSAKQVQGALSLGVYRVGTALSPRTVTKSNLFDLFFVSKDHKNHSIHLIGDRYCVSTDRHVRLIEQ